MQFLSSFYQDSYEVSMKIPMKFLFTSCPGSCLDSNAVSVHFHPDLSSNLSPLRSISIHSCEHPLAFRCSQLYSISIFLNAEMMNAK